MSLRALMVIPSYFPKVGGAEKQLGHLARQLVSNNVAVQVVTRRLKGTSASETVDGIPVARIGGEGTFWFLVALAKYIVTNRNKIDIIHVHTLNSPAFIAALCGRVIGLPVVLKVTRSGKNTQLSRYMSSPVSRNLFTAMVNWSDKVVAITSDVLHELIVAGLSEQKISLIPNGVISRETDTNLRDRREIRIVYVGRLIKRKRVDMLISALSEVKSQQSISVSIIGSGVELDSLKKHASTLISELPVHFVGEKSQAEVFNYLAGAEIFVLPSESEGMSNALLEAMASDNAVIATKIPANEELIEHNKNGLLFSTVEELADCLQSLVEDEPLRQALAMEGKTTIASRFSMGKVASQYKNMYLELISSKMAERRKKVKASASSK